MKPIEVYLIQGDVEVLVSENSNWLNTLTSPDLEQFKRFKHPGARAQFLTGRWLMRRVLEDAGLDWNDVDRSVEKFTHPGVHFNLSHVDGLVGLAIDFEHPIGLDVEWIRRGTNRAQLMPRQFAKDEISWVELAESDDQHRERFFKLWTIKEAILKAEGCGLRVDTRTMRASVEEGALDTDFERPWDVYSTHVGEHVLSLATPLTPRHVHIQVWNPAGWTQIEPSLDLLKHRHP